MHDVLSRERNNCCIVVSSYLIKHEMLSTKSSDQNYEPGESAVKCQQFRYPALSQRQGNVCSTSRLEGNDTVTFLGWLWAAPWCSDFPYHSVASLWSDQCFRPELAWESLHLNLLHKVFMAPAYPHFVSM